MAFVSFFDISAMAPIARSRIVIINNIVGVVEFHTSFFVEISSRSFCEVIIGIRKKTIFVFFLISFGDEDET
jgi:hypothetical protein